MTSEVTIPATLNREQIDLIKHTVAVGASDNELKLFLYQANKRGLDPLARQIHFIKRKKYNPETEKYEDVGTIQTGIDGFRVVADRTGKLAGISRGVLRDDKGNLIGAWAEIYRSDWTHPAREEVSFKEYCQKKKDGSPMGLWATMPETMLKKVAEAAALRMAFPEDLSGIYSHDEMQQADTEPISQVKQPQVKTATNKTQADRDIEALYEGEKPALKKQPEPPQETVTPENTGIEGKDKGNIPKRDLATIKTITDMYKACHTDFGLQPKDVLAELKITAWSELSILPSEAYTLIASEREGK